jgi:tetratricopeptide (TPR) repeat protein
MQLQYDKALRDFNKAIAYQPHNFPFAYNNKGYVYLQQDKTEQAIEYFKKCLAEDAGLVEANLNIALVFYKQGDKEKARFYLEQDKELASHFQNGLDNFFKSNEKWFFWTDEDKEMIRKMIEEFN